VEQKEMRETNSLVEEFMLLANISVAKKIQETFPQTAVLRYANQFYNFQRDTNNSLDGIYLHHAPISRNSRISWSSGRV
jgi:hypothetical protein